MAPPRPRTSRSPWHPHPPQPWELGNSGVREAPPRPPPPAPSPASLRDLFRWLDALDLHGDDRLSPPHADFRAGFARAFADGVLAAEVVHKALTRQRVRIGRFPILEHSNGRTKVSACHAHWSRLSDDAHCPRGLTTLLVSDERQLAFTGSHGPFGVPRDHARGRHHRGSGFRRRGRGRGGAPRREGGGRRATECLACFGAPSRCRP